MTSKSNVKQSEALGNRVQHLRQSHRAHLDLARKLAEADEGRIFGLDLVAWAVLNRSLCLIDGVVVMVETRNLLCAGALLRLQIDSLMRLYAGCLIDNPHLLVNLLLKGESFRSVRSKSGERLTDAYLRTELAKIHPWVSSVYSATSGFVHLSKPHIFSTISSFEQETHDVQFGLGTGAREVKDGELVEMLDWFIEATRCVLHLVVSWLNTKEAAAAARPPESQ